MSDFEVVGSGTRRVETAENGVGSTVFYYNLGVKSSGDRERDGRGEIKGKCLVRENVVSCNKNQEKVDLKRELGSGEDVEEGEALI